MQFSKTITFSNGILKRLGPTLMLGSVLALAAGSTSAQVLRNPFLWPFSPSSIWNQPLGSGATYYPLGLPPVGQNRTDWEYISQTTASDPVRYDVYNGTWLSLSVRDDDPVAPLSADDRSTNGIVAVVQPDGHVYQLNYGDRQTYGGNLTGLPFGWSWFNSFAYTDLMGTGYYGSHGGSRLSGMGGSIRAWELQSDDDYAIRHAVKIELDANFLWKNGANPLQSYVWPALTADSSTSGYGVYKNDSALAMGSLLALPPSATPAALGIKTAAGRKLFHALQDYGAYVVDTSGYYYKNNGRYILSLCADRASRDVFDLDTPGDFLSDVSAMEQNLAAITNNTPQSIGGGGTPRRSLAPPFASVQNGVYKIVNRNSGLNLDVSGGSQSDSASVIQYHDNGGNNQRWALTWVSGTGFKLRNVNSGKNLDVYGGSRADYATVVQYHDNGGSNQLWNLADTGGYYKIQNVNSGKNLDVYGGSYSDGAAVIQYYDTGGSNQHWSLAAP